LRNLSGQPRSMDHPASATWGLAVEMSERENEWVLRADLPKVERSDISLFVTNHGLCISAPTRQESGALGYYKAERQLPVGVPPDRIKARFTEGVLEVRLPKSPEARRRVPIEWATS
jgi:HSP20 family protein